MALTIAEVFQDPQVIQSAIVLAAEQGYAFVHNAVSWPGLRALIAEAEKLPFEQGEYDDKKPIKEYKERKVTQSHQRFYAAVDDPRVPVSTFLIDSLVELGKPLHAQYPGLADWRANEIGLQRYVGKAAHISKHRDRHSDKILAATFTIRGAALVGIHEALGDPNDYNNTRQIDDAVVAAGSIMFLRAPGLGTGEQVIHEVSPPLVNERLIANLRMRPLGADGQPDILKQPSQER